jgi:hypothetical protein
MNCEWKKRRIIKWKKKKKSHQTKHDNERMHNNKTKKQIVNRNHSKLKRKVFFYFPFIKKNPFLLKISPTLLFFLRKITLLTNNIKKDEWKSWTSEEFNFKFEVNFKCLVLSNAATSSLSIKKIYMKWNYKIISEMFLIAYSTTTNNRNVFPFSN